MNIGNMTISSDSSNHSIVGNHDIQVWSIPYFIGGVFVILLNLLTLLTYAVNTNLRRRNVYLLLSLCVADTLVGVTMVTYSLSIISRKFVPFRPLMDTFESVAAFDMFSSIASFKGLVLISLERMLATVSPIRFRNLSNRAYYIALAIQWSYAIISFPLFLLQKTFFLHYIASFSLSLGLMIICIAYTSIFITVKKQHRRHQQAALPSAQHRERELAKTLFIVTVLSLLSWLPDSIETMIYGTLFNFYYSIISTLLRYTNSLVNPVVYLFRMRDFRHALCALVCRCARDRPLVVDNGNRGIRNGKSVFRMERIRGSRFITVQERPSTCVLAN